MLIPRFRIYLNTMSLARKNKLSVPEYQPDAGWSPMEAGELPLKASRDKSPSIFTFPSQAVSQYILSSRLGNV
jgi:hypothetical protein